MAVYQHILAAVDFSDESDRVVEKAIELANQNGAKLSLIYVVAPIGLVYAEEIPLPADFDLEDQLAAQAKNKLEALRKKYDLEGVKELVAVGTPKQEIVQAAREEAVDLIVIGSHGRHGIQLLLGSTANGVLHTADCDVLAVRVGKEES